MANTAIIDALEALEKVALDEASSIHWINEAVNSVYVQLTARVDDDHSSGQELVAKIILVFSKLELRVMPEIVTRFIMNQYPRDHDLNTSLPSGWSFVSCRASQAGRHPRGYIINGELAKLVFDECVRRGIYSNRDAWTLKPIDTHDLQSVVDQGDGSFWEKLLILPWPAKSLFVDSLLAIMPV